MKRNPCVKDEKDNVHMTQQNLNICLRNQEGYDNKILNQSLHLQYYGFCDINNLKPFTSLHTLYLNNNTIQVIQNLESLGQLCVLNLSYNRIKKIQGINVLVNLHTVDFTSNIIDYVFEEEIKSLTKLSQLKLGYNKFTNYQSLQAIKCLRDSLTYLDLSFNQEISYDSRFYSDLFAQMKLITVLSLQSTTFSLSVPSYRKQTINTISSLLFLDDRPITQDEKSLAKAWKEGGLVLEREVRQKIRQKLQEKSDKIYNQMQERVRVAEQKRKRAFQKITHKQRIQLQSLKSKVQQQNFDLQEWEEKNQIKLRIDDLQQYLQLVRNEIPQMDIEKILGDGRVQVPKMIIDNQTPTAIYVYNVSQEQIPLIKQKYYPNQQREIIAVNYESKTQKRWINEYDGLLLDCYKQLKGNLDLLVSTFNLSLYQYDINNGRKAKRFQIQQLKQHLGLIKRQQQARQKSIQVLYELD